MVACPAVWTACWLLLDIAVARSYSVLPALRNVALTEAVSNTGLFLSLFRYSIEIFYLLVMHRLCYILSSF